MKECIEYRLNQQLEKFANAIEYPLNQNTKKKCKFVSDGIIDVKKYTKASPKILWILKEVNSANDDYNVESDVRTFITEIWDEENNKLWNRLNQTFAPIAYCTYGIFEKKKWDDLPDINGDAKKLLKHIPKIAFINVKKYAGRSVANKNEIQFFYNRYKDFLHEQIELINPDVIIFGGTFNFFDEIFFRSFGKKKQYISKKRHLQKYQYGNKLLLSTYHPGQTIINRKIYCSSIIGAVNRWLCNCDLSDLSK